MKENFSSPSKPRRRRLTAEETELWREATRNVARRPEGNLPSSPAEANPPELPPSEDSKSPPLGPLPQLPPVTVPEVTVRPKLAPIERQLRQKLSRGRMAPDAMIDLHGLRQREASVALRNFLVRAQAEGARLVLVVTGKGERLASSGLTPGILRKNVPNWLRSMEYQPVVAGFEEAARPHGGTGALYVRLRRRNRARGTKPAP